MLKDGSKWVIVVFPLIADDVINGEVRIIKRSERPKQEHLIMTIPGLDELIEKNPDIPKKLEGEITGLLHETKGLFSQKIFEMMHYYPISGKNRLGPGIKELSGKGIAAKVEARFLNWLRKKIPGLRIIQTHPIREGRLKQLRDWGIENFQGITLEEQLRKNIQYRRKKRQVRK